MDETHLEVFLSPAVRDILAKLQNILAQRHIEAYIVGGLVRDMVMGRNKADIDIAIAGDALAIGPEIAVHLKAHCVVLDSENSVVRLLPQKEGLEVFEAWQIDVATLQGNLAEDLGRRDFTVNALAIDLAKLSLTSNDKIEATVIDPFGGLGDIQKKLIRAVNPQVFKNDAIRLLRGLRLGADLGFVIESQTEALIERDHELIKNVAGERVREELLRLLALPDSYQAIVYMDKLGLLTAIIPELAPTRDVDQPKEHAWNVFHHSARSISALDFILRRSGWAFADSSVLAGIPWDENIESYFEAKVSPLSTRRVLTKLAALLHDIAKPQTRIVNEFGRVRFYGHPQEGAPVAAAILERLRFSKHEIKFVETIVRYHLRPVQMTEDGAPPTRRAVYRYFRDMDEAAIATLYFSLADHLATRGPDLEKANWDWHVGVMAHLITEHEKAPETIEPPKLLDGHDLKHALGLTPGPRLGELLEELREAQAAGEITTREEALDYVKKMVDEGEKQTRRKGSA
ncbi:MAG: CCA tRNA nucleotidyltransferase [Dehalococcoidia bacterium]|nr:MAG: CCA tRNA nucleotidyltransferase [Dehalococcoidia bacterium]